MKKAKIISFSGGRSSAVNVSVAIEKFGRENLHFLYLDTGAEHPKTYEFIKQVVSHFDIDLICLRPIVNKGKKSSDYKIVSLDDIGCDMVPITDVMQKYGKPSFNAASCTREMKKTLANKWRKDTFGKGNSEMWLGIRADEPARLVGASNHTNMRQAGFNDDDILDMFTAWTSGGVFDLAHKFPHNDKYKSLFSDLFNYLQDRDVSEGLHYMAEISDFDKQDVLNFWKKMPFDLQIKEHLGNCVFCVKKSVNKIALAIRDEPELFEKWEKALSLASNREDLPKIHELQKHGIIYRGNNNLESIIEKFEHLTRDELEATIRSMRPLKIAEDGGCSESCEAF